MPWSNLLAEQRARFETEMNKLNEQLRALEEELEDDADNHDELLVRHEASQEQLNNITHEVNGLQQMQEEATRHVLVSRQVLESRVPISSLQIDELAQLIRNAQLGSENTPPTDWSTELRALDERLSTLTNETIALREKVEKPPQRPWQKELIEAQNRTSRELLTLNTAATQSVALTDLDDAVEKLVTDDEFGDLMRNELDALRFTLSSDDGGCGFVDYGKARRVFKELWDSDQEARLLLILKKAAGDYPPKATVQVLSATTSRASQLQRDVSREVKKLDIESGTHFCLLSYLAAQR